jgi:hypothetical protein
MSNETAAQVGGIPAIHDREDVKSCFLASITIKIAAARKKNRMSTVIDLEAGVTRVSLTKEPSPGNASVTLLKYATFWLHVAISAATEIVAYTAQSTLRDVGILAAGAGVSMSSR